MPFITHKSNKTITIKITQGADWHESIFQKENDFLEATKFFQSQLI